MAAEFTPVTSAQELDRCFERSATTPVIVYNHDPYCPICTRAIRELGRVSEAIAMINVSEEHALTRVLAERTGVKHESPQVVILKDGHSVWNASHFAINTKAVESAYAAACNAGVPN